MISRFSSIDFVVERTETSVRGTMICRAVRFENWKTPSMISRFSSERMPGLLRVRQDQAQLFLRVHHLRVAGRLDADERAGRAFVVRFSSQMTGYIST